MATLKSIDVRATCPKCGVVDKFTVLGGTRFCSLCLSQHLVAAGVPMVEMQTVKRMVEPGVEGYQCPFCGETRSVGSGACEHCGKQDIEKDGHYLCTACGKLTRTGQSCEHCGA